MTRTALQTVEQHQAAIRSRDLDAIVATYAGAELVGTNTFVVADGLITVNTGFITSAATPAPLAQGRR